VTYDVKYTKEIFADNQRGMSCFQQTHVSEADGCCNRLGDDNGCDKVSGTSI
jgi:hypothetical protein